VADDQPTWLAIAELAFGSARALDGVNNRDETTGERVVQS